jgi:hypothetical protein
MQFEAVESKVIGLYKNCRWKITIDGFTYAQVRVNGCSWRELEGAEAEATIEASVRPLLCPKFLLGLSWLGLYGPACGKYY